MEDGGTSYGPCSAEANSSVRKLGAYGRIRCVTCFQYSYSKEQS